MDGDDLALQTLASSELFAGLSPEGLADVLAAAGVRHLLKDATIFNQGEGGVRAHTLIEGSVRIVQTGSDGGQIVIRFIGAGETFGTVALFTDHRYPADALAVSDSIEASWTETALRALMARYPRIAMNVIEIIGKRLQEVQERVRELSTQRVEQRIARVVLRLAHQAGHNTLDGTAIAFPLRRKDVADIAGTTLHTASRILTAWEKAGLLTSHHQHLVIRRPAEMRRIAEDTNG